MAEFSYKLTGILIKIVFLLIINWSPFGGRNERQLRILRSITAAVKVSIYLEIISLSNTIGYILIAIILILSDYNDRIGDVVQI